jgi:hypothetical protein
MPFQSKSEVVLARSSLSLDAYRCPIV